MMKNFALVIPVLMLIFSTLAGNLKIESGQRYLLLATQKTSTMQKELDEASALGFRVIVGSPTSGSEMAILLEKTAEPPETYKYSLLATTRTSTMQKELNEAAEEGFRLIPSTMISKSGMLGGVEVVVLLERPPKVENKYLYRLLATNLTSTLQREILEAMDEGYVVAGMVSRGEHMVILEKEVKVE